MQHRAAGQPDRQLFFLRGADRQRLGADVQRVVVLVHPPLHLQRHIPAVHHRLRQLDALAVVQLHVYRAADPFDVDGAEALDLYHLAGSGVVARVRLRRNGRVRRSRIAAVLRLRRPGTGRQCQRHDQRQQARHSFFHGGIPHFLSLSQIVTCPVSRVRSMSMTRWFRLPRNWREMSFSSLTNRPSTSTLMQASIPSVASHRG